MFKKSKKSPEIAPPTPPSAEEIIEDMKTFHVDIPINIKKSNTVNQQNSIEDWWETFEQSLQNFEALKELNNKLESCKIELQRNKLENETQAKELKAEIERQQAKAKKYLGEFEASVDKLKKEVEAVNI